MGVAVGNRQSELKGVDQEGWTLRTPKKGHQKNEIGFRLLRRHVEVRAFKPYNAQLFSTLTEEFLA